MSKSRDVAGVGRRSPDISKIGIIPRRHHGHEHDHHRHHDRHRQDASSEVTITPTKNGPYCIRGKVSIVTPDGRAIETDGEEVWLCRCGQSANNPFCDGVHKWISFQSDLDSGLVSRTIEGYQDVGAEQDVMEGKLKGLRIDGNPVVLSRVGGQLYAIGGLCTHKPVLLADGELDGSVVRCPAHGGCFDIRTGRAVRRPPVEAAPTYEVKVEEGRLLVSCQPR